MRNFQISRQGRLPEQRLEAFSDGVIAILITTIVFAFKPPKERDVPALLGLTNGVSTYVLS